MAAVWRIHWAALSVFFQSFSIILLVDMLPISWATGRPSWRRRNWTSRVHASTRLLQRMEKNKSIKSMGNDTFIWPSGLTEKPTIASYPPDWVTPWGVIQLSQHLRTISVPLQQIHPRGWVCIQALVVVPRLTEVNILTTPHCCRKGSGN